MLINSTILTVKQLNTYIKNIIEDDNKLRSIFIKGEISNFTNHYKSGHLYLTLKDEESVIKSVMFKSSAIKLLFTPKDGMKVIARGKVSVFERVGQYQLYIEEMIVDGLGDLNLAYEKLKEKLKLEGLFDIERKKPIPKYPKSIGVITSPTGAAVRDIINILKRRMPLTKVFIYPVLVQGKEAPIQLIEAIKYFNENFLVDSIIIGRGGGSLEELWAFNDELLARTIFNSKIPIISAVGHETDFTIADFVSDLRAPTPSAAAEISVADKNELSNKFSEISSKLKILLTRDLKNKINTFERYSKSPVLLNPYRYIDEKKMNFDYLLKSLVHISSKTTSLHREKLSILVGKLSSLSPLSILSRGYNITKDKNGKFIKSINEININDELSLKFYDGIAICNVLKIINAKGEKKNG